jgi:hypothetical protein
MEILPTTSAHYPGLATLYNSIDPQFHLSASDFIAGDRLLDPNSRPGAGSPSRRMRSLARGITPNPTGSPTLKNS